MISHLQSVRRFWFNLHLVGWAPVPALLAKIKDWQIIHASQGVSQDNMKKIIKHPMLPHELKQGHKTGDGI